MTAHIESKKEDISELVLMPGDPLRAKRIADKFLTDVKQVNSVRNMYGFTGFFGDTKITVFASGMGIPSIGIYAYELYKFYDVKKIIRIGSSGSLNPDVKIFDTVLAKSASSCSSFFKLFDETTEQTFEATLELNQKIIDTAKENNIELKVGDIITSDVFDPYTDNENFINNFPDKDYYASEMEAACLFYLAKKLNKEAACLLTVVDSKYEPDRVVTSEERQNNLDKMIYLALLSLTNNN